MLLFTFAYWLASISRYVFGFPSCAIKAHGTASLHSQQLSNRDILFSGFSAGHIWTGGYGQYSRCGYSHRHRWAGRGVLDVGNHLSWKLVHHHIGFTSNGYHQAKRHHTASLDICPKSTCHNHQRFIFLLNQLLGRRAAGNK